MAETHVISALVAKRSELAGLVEHHRKEIAKLSEDIALLDSTIKMFEPGYRIQTIKPKRFQRKNAFFKRGEANRTILDILRESGKPLSTVEIARVVSALKGFDKDQERALQATILTTLHNQRKNGLVEFTGRDFNGGCVWKLA
ncbi:hypothetical protein JCM14076_30200 [Methylosoma difficile]